MRDTMINNTHSGFWLGDNWNNPRSMFEDVEFKPKVDLIALASYRRAVSNFVNIVTGKDIPVTFTTSGDSFTDGKSVTISAKLDETVFDSTVGLALHEGSHILLSEFDFLKNLSFNCPQEYFNRSDKKGFSVNETIGHIKCLLNYVEDRRIDNYIYNTSPGYTGYYKAMYAKYFHAKVIDTALLSDEYTDENVDSYFFRIINLTNSNTRLDALTGLRQVWNVLDLRRIDRLNSTTAAFDVALSLYQIILDNISDGIESTDPETGVSTYSRVDGKSPESDDSQLVDMSDEDFETLLEDVVNGKVDTSSNETKSDEKRDPSKNYLSKRQAMILEKAIETQRDFLDGNVSKKKVSKSNKKAIDAVEKSGMSYKEVGGDVADKWSGEKLNKSINCIVVKNLTKELIHSNQLDILRKSRTVRNDKAIIDGMKLGLNLGKKLQIRTESRETKYTRKDTGRIDKRLISELGFGNSNVFSQTFIDSFPDAFIHVSVDASGSMYGSRWENTITSVVAMVKAIDMIEGVDIVVSFRSSQADVGRSNYYCPILLIAYDSRKDNLIKVKTLWNHINVAGTTPEGLCLDAIIDEMEFGGTDKESYFLNFSDGMPMFSTVGFDYYHDVAINHTKLMVKKIRERGIKVLSYYIGDGDGGRCMDNFKQMYGRDSQFVDVTSVTAVARSMNKKFLEK
jgi:hypothetical protein